MRLAIWRAASDERRAIYAVARHRSTGTRVPRPLANLFRREDPLVLLARKTCPMKLGGQALALRNEQLNCRRAPRGFNYETYHHHCRDDRPHARCCKTRCSAKPLHRAHYRGPVLRPESVQSPWMPSEGRLGWLGRPELSCDLFQQPSRKHY